jgi:tetratricopeptide (TPR) repeat protein
MTQHSSSASASFSNPRVRIFLAITAALVLAIAIAIGCKGSSSGGGGAGEGDNGQVVDTEIMAFLSEARALHLQANLKEEAGDVAGAAAAMERLVAARRPHDGKAPEVQEVLADAYARLAELQLKLNALPKAADAVKTGLSHAPDPTYFRGHLVEVEGLIEEARAMELADAGNPEEAAKSREKAIQLLEEVVKIQDQVIQRSLAAREAGAGPEKR